MSPLHKTSLIVEVPCQSTDDVWCNSDDLISKVRNDLIDIGFFVDNDIIDSCVYKIHHAYPILELGFEKKLDSIFKYLDAMIFKYHDDQIFEYLNIILRLKFK